MALPNATLDALDRLEVLGVPKFAGHGVKLTPKFSPDVDAAGVLAIAQDILADIDLTLTLPALPAVGIDVDFLNRAWSVLAKHVEFAPAQQPETADKLKPTTDAAINDLPHTIPLAGNAVALSPKGLGFIARADPTDTSKLKGTIDNGLSRLQATLKGTIKGPPVDAKIKVSWRLTGDGERPLTEGRDFVFLDNTTAIDIAPVILPLPHFAELSKDPNRTWRLNLYCDVTLGASTASRTIGPVLVDVPVVGVPTLAIMTEHASDQEKFPGEVLITVPYESALDDSWERAFDALVQLQGAIDVVKVALGVAAMPFLEAIDAINKVTDLLPKSKRVRFKRALQDNRLPSFWDIDPGPHWLGLHTSWDDATSAIFAFGPPGRQMSFHCLQECWLKKGAFRVEIGQQCAAAVLHLWHGPTSAIPAQLDPKLHNTSVTIEHPVDPEGASFNDRISSMRFF